MAEGWRIAGGRLGGLGGRLIALLPGGGNRGCLGVRCGAGVTGLLPGVSAADEVYFSKCGGGGFLDLSRTG